MSEDKKTNLIVGSGESFTLSKSETEAVESCRFTVSDGLAYLRSEKGLSQPEMAALMDVSLRSYQGYEKGDRAIPVNAIEELFRNASVDLNQLFTGSKLLPTDSDITRQVSIILTADRFLRKSCADLSDDAREAVILTYLKVTNNFLFFEKNKILPIVEMHRNSKAMD